MHIENDSVSHNEHSYGADITFHRTYFQLLIKLFF